MSHDIISSDSASYRGRKYQSACGEAVTQLLKQSQSRAGPAGGYALKRSYLPPASVSALQGENWLRITAFTIVVIKKKKSERFTLEKVGKVEFLYFGVGMFIFTTCEWLKGQGKFWGCWNIM